MPGIALLEKYQHATSYCPQSNTCKIKFDTYRQARQFMQMLLLQEETKHNGLGLIKGDDQAVVVLFLSAAFHSTEQVAFGWSNHQPPKATCFGNQKRTVLGNNSTAKHDRV
jgi:hypothetical protein